MIVSAILDEMKSFGIPDDIAVRISRDLIRAGQQSVFASLGEVCGKAALDETDIEQMVASLLSWDYTK